MDHGIKIDDNAEVLAEIIYNKLLEVSLLIIKPSKWDVGFSFLIE